MGHPARFRGQAVRSAAPALGGRDRRPPPDRRLSTSKQTRTYTREIYAVSKVRHDRRVHARRIVRCGLACVSRTRRERGWTRRGARELERRCEHGSCSQHKVEDAYSWTESFEPCHPRKQAVRHYRHLKRRKSSAQDRLVRKRRLSR